MKTTVSPLLGAFATSSGKTRLAKEVALLRLRMYSLGGHVIIPLPGFLLDETSIPETTLIPALVD